MKKIFIALSLCICVSTVFSQSKEEALAAMKRATRFMTEKVGNRGAYVWAYSADMSRRWGELEAFPSMGWVQPPGTASIGHILLDAYHASGDEYYYKAAAEVANTLIWAQLPCGGWNYMFDFAGEESLKKWYATIGRQAWRMEEFHHYYGNATFDDGGTICAAELMLRMFLEKKDEVYRKALDKAIGFVLESQYPSGGWPQRYPLRYDHIFRGKADYSSFITLNDDVCQKNTDFLIKCYQNLDIDSLLPPINRAMELLMKLQCKAPCPGWADQYFVESLLPAHARSYEPLGVNASTTAEMIGLLMDFYKMTGNRDYLIGIPSAIQFLESLKLPENESVNVGRPPRDRQQIVVSRYIDPDTGKPQYIHRKGSNVCNGLYWFDSDSRNTVTHLSSFAFINISALQKAYSDVLTLSPDSLAEKSPLLKKNRQPLKKYYYSFNPFRFGNQNVSAVIESLNSDGCWLTPLMMTSNPYNECGASDISEETKYATTRVGDEYDTSTYSPETLEQGVSTQVYIGNMMSLINYIEKLNNP